MTDTPAQGAQRLLTLVLSLAGLVAIACAAVAFFNDWGSDAAAPWRTAALIAAGACAVLGVGYAVMGKRS